MKIMNLWRLMTMFFIFTTLSALPSEFATFNSFAAGMSFTLAMLESAKEKSWI